MTGNEKLTIKQIASEVGVDERTVRRWIKSNQLPVRGYDIHGRYLVLRSDLEAFINRRTRVDKDTNE